MIVLDASVLIGHLDAGDAHHGRATDLLRREVDDDLAASPLTLAEVLVAPTRGGRRDAALAALAILEVTVVPLSDDAAVRLAQLRADTGLKMPDCCVLLAAEAAGARLATFDERLTNAASGRDLVVVDR